MTGTGDQPALDVFTLRDRVVEDHRHFATSFTTVHAQDIREQIAAICLSPGGSPRRASR